MNNIIESFVPKEIVPALKQLGKCEWFIRDPVTNKLIINKKELNNEYKQLSVIDRFLLDPHINTGNIISTFSLYGISKLLFHGPKVFRPSVVQCEAMRNVSAEFEIKDYRQPFPAIVIELPDEFVQIHNVNKNVLCFHSEASKFIHLYTTRLSAEKEIYSCLICEVGRTIESVISGINYDAIPELGEAGFHAAHLSERIAINCCLMMTCHDPRLRWLNSFRRQSLIKDLRSPSHKTAAKARLELPAEAQIIEFSQSIKFYDEEDEKPIRQPGPPKGGEKLCHWRKGFFKRQPHGPGFSLRKLIFIKPVLVRRDRFMGEEADTQVVYHGRDHQQDRIALTAATLCMTNT